VFWTDAREKFQLQYTKTKDNPKLRIRVNHKSRSWLPLRHIRHAPPITEAPYWNEDTPTHTHQNHTASQTHFYSDILVLAARRIAQFSVSAITGELAIIGTTKTKDNSKGLGLLILHLFSHLGERLHVRPLPPPPPPYIPNKTLPLTQSIMQAKTVLSTHNTHRI